MLGTSGGGGSTPAVSGAGEAIGDQDRAKSPFDAPSLSLPKGGGAIRGIGEKFAANPVTGTGSMSVPLGLNPGRDGFGPQLSLTYDSGHGNGPFGVGWSLAVPAITRKTDKGLPRYDDAGDSDVFILSGSEDLVPVLKQDGNGDWVRDPTGRHLFEAEDRDGYTVRRYRPRVEGLFARIERWTRLADGDVHWRSISRDNVTTLYGRDTESRIADPAHPSHVFSWLVCESYDDKGNALVYRYKPEDSSGVDPSLAHEHNRSPLTRSANRLLKRILYGNRVSRLVQPDLAQAEWMFEAVFDYGEHDHDSPTPDEPRTWLCRNDPYSVYRAGFEVRAYRLCQRVLMFHHFPEPGVGANCLVRSTDFTYRDTRGVPLDQSRGHPLGSFIASIAQSGYRRTGVGSGTGYLKKSLPAVEFAYSEAVIQDAVHELDPDSLANLPVGLSPDYRWVDLDGEGISGILNEQPGDWLYKPNLGAGRFGPVERIARTPSLAALRGGRQQLLDLDGSGHLDLVEFGGGTPGYVERTDERDWAVFTSFRSRPNIAWDDPELRFVDLDGDGHADVLITGNDAFTWHQSLAKEGFGPARRVAAARDEERGPRLVFADGSQSVYLADMSGDGLTDLVRIRNGDVCYWANLGYGLFGPKVTMDGAPWFDHVDQFHHERVRLADVDGSGTADLLYLGRDGVKVYFNESGNSWGAPHLLPQLPHIDNVSSVTTADLLGNGTACLVWSSPLPGDARSPVRYIDLVGGQKPHLLVKVDNNLGAETQIGYASSTKSYLADKAAGTPWITKLAFPVHVVERVEVHDRVSRNQFVTRYAFHHGFFDGVEREFRGFGLVDQFDTETFESLGSADGAHAAGPANVDAASHVPPVLTRTWYHTGAYLGRERISNFHAGLTGGRARGEYYREPAWLDDPAEAAKHFLPDSRLPAGLTLEDEREACRALKGSMLRQEVYALDDPGSDDYPLGHPYTVTEQNFSLRVLQPQGENRHAVCIAHVHEAIHHHYERSPDDPRSTHELTLEIDDFGNVLKSASVGYGRRRPDPALPVPDQAEQTRTLVTYAENSFTNPVEALDDHRTPLPSQTVTFELTGYPPTGPAGRFQDSDFVRPDPLHPGRMTQSFDTELAFEQPPTSGRQRRLIGHVRTLYRRDDLSGLLPFGGAPSLEPRAIPGATYKLAFTAGLLAQVYQNRLPDPATILAGRGAEQGGYLSGASLKAAGEFPATDPDDHWWIPSGRIYLAPDPASTPAQEQVYARQHFFGPRRYRGPFHTDAVPTETVVTYDAYDLMVAETRDAVGNVSTVVTEDDTGASAPRIDYRVLLPYWSTDPNGNRVRVAFDALGLVTGTAVMGKAPPAAAEGDSLTGFDADLTDAVVAAHLADPLTDPQNLLGRATTRLVYDLFAYQRTKSQAAPQPAVVHTLARETHDSDPVPVGGLRIQHSFSYSDGFGREIQKKAQAEAGPVPVRSADGTITVAADGQPVMTRQDAASRWIGTGWTVFNNKGKPVRQFEPFFTDTHRFESDVRIGVSPVLFYDPVERVIATLHPDRTWQKVVFGPWRQETWDANDTVLAADPGTDPDVGDHFRRLPAADYLPTWSQQREAGGLGPQEQDAARKAAVHAGTPSVAHTDSLGRTALTVAHNKLKYSDAPAGDPPVEEFHRTRATFDISGHQRAVLDERTKADGTLEQRVVMRFDYDVVGTHIHQASMEAGERWLLNDVTGKPLATWDSRGHRFRTVYDPLRRPTDSFLKEDPAAEVLIERVVYGEGQPSPETHNLRGKVVRHFDQAGIITSDFDFKGNTLSSRRQLASTYSATLNWAAAPPLENETFTTRTRFDALNRPIQTIEPHSDQPGTTVTLVQPVYNEAGLLEQVHVWLDRNAEPAGLLDPATADLHAVTAIDYDAKRQRTLIDYGNGTRTTYGYDPRTHRLIQLVTSRDPAAFSDDCPQPPTAAWPGCQVQSLSYTYDPAGNVTHIRDDAQQTRFFRNRRVEPSADYTYDAVYRLIEATGREHLGQAGAAPSPSSYNDKPRVGILLAASDGNAVARYLERFVYDEAGNFRQLIHRGSDPANPGWTRTYDYAEPSLLEPGAQSNRLTGTAVGATTETYSAAGDGYDAHGNMLRMPQLQTMRRDFRDHLVMTQRQAVNAADDEGVHRQGERTYYTYDAAGQRVRKVTELATGEVKDERIYLGGFEIYRRHGASPLTRETLHVMDDTQRVALIETRTRGDEPGVPRRLVRYQFGNHLGSACLELDEAAQIISYEECTPYGSTSLAAVRSQTETPKRYRYTGKERDEESGLYYHGARYYAPWLGRWVSADPGGLVDGPNLFRYVADNPVKLVDPSGRQSEPKQPEYGINPRLDPTKDYQTPDQKLASSLGAVRDPKLAAQGRPDLKTWDSQFEGPRGEQFRKAIQDAATEMGVDPGLLAANALAEADSRDFWLNGAFTFKGRTMTARRSDIAGLDFWVSQQAGVKAAVPAAKDINASQVSWFLQEPQQEELKKITDPKAREAFWQKNRLPVVGFADAKTALRALAAMTKFHEIQLEKQVGAEAWGKLTDAERFALTRYSFNAGPNAVKKLAAQAVASKDILVRSGPMRVAVPDNPMGRVIPDRAATIIAAQALHLSDTIFGNHSLTYTRETH